MPNLTDLPHEVLLAIFEHSHAVPKSPSSSIIRQQYATLEKTADTDPLFLPLAHALYRTIHWWSFNNELNAPSLRAILESQTILLRLLLLRPLARSQVRHLALTIAVPYKDARPGKEPSASLRQLLPLLPNLATMSFVIKDQYRHIALPVFEKSMEMACAACFAKLPTCRVSSFVLQRSIVGGITALPTCLCPLGPFMLASLQVTLESCRILRPSFPAVGRATCLSVIWSSLAPLEDASVLPTFFFLFPRLTRLRIGVPRLDVLASLQNTLVHLSIDCSENRAVPLLDVLPYLQPLAALRHLDFTALELHAHQTHDTRHLLGCLPRGLLVVAFKLYTNKLALAGSHCAHLLEQASFLPELQTLQLHRISYPETANDPIADLIETVVACRQVCARRGIRFIDDLSQNELNPEVQ